MKRLISSCRLICVILAIACVVGGLPRSLRADDAARGFVDLIQTDESGDHKYVVFVPRNYVPEKKWPVILYLHGAGERGSDGRKQLSVGLGPYVKQHAEDFPFLVVFPQCEDLEGRILTCWAADSPDGRRALAILDSVEQQYNIDGTQRILTGWSMGGYGTWSLAAAQPNHWSAVVPMSGGGDVAIAANLKEIPIWAFHGADDRVVRPQESRAMVEAVNTAGGHVRYTEVSGVAHYTWKYGYARNELYQWMLDPNKSASAETALLAKPGERPLLTSDEEEPFVPAVEIPNALYARLGNDMLHALAYSVPKIIPADVMVGNIGDIHESTVASGRQFNVHFTRIAYDAKIERAVVKAYQPNRLNVQLGLRNARLTIGRTYLAGSGRSAVAGTINVVIGHQRPVWLSLALEPYIDNRKIRVKLVATRFDIPDDNWFVSAPQGVSTQGLGMTRDVVSNGLVNGIYEKKARIQQEVRAVVPKVVEQIEGHLERKELTDMVNAFWPLPVYRPRVRLWPQEISTDENGVSIAFGMTAAAVDPKNAPKTPLVLDPVGPSLANLPRGKGLRVGMAPNMIEPLTQLLIDADVARIHVRDIPAEHFAQLADFKSLAEAIPDLKQYDATTEIWSELVLVHPLSILETAAPDSMTFVSDEFPDAVRAPKPDELEDAWKHRLRISAPRAIISLAIRTDSQQNQWTPYAEFEFTINQDALAVIASPSFTQRALRLDWTGDATVSATGRFSPGYAPKNSAIDVEKVRRLFLESWHAWTKQGVVSEMTVPDLDFGYSKLRMNEAGWSGNHLAIDFINPSLKIANESNIDLVYETKGPYSGWGGPYTLSPGKSHEFDVPYPLIYRQKLNGEYRLYTLPAGSHLEYRSSSKDQKPGLFQAREISKRPDSTGGKE